MWKVTEQFKEWLEARNHKKVKDIETIFSSGRVMFISDGVRWDFHHNYKGGLICSLKKETLSLLDIVAPDVFRETLALVD